MKQEKLKKTDELIALLTHSDIDIREKAFEFWAKDLLLHEKPLLSPEDSGLGNAQQENKGIYVVSFYNHLANQVMYLNKTECWNRFFAIIDKTIEMKSVFGVTINAMMQILDNENCSEQWPEILFRLQKLQDLNGNVWALHNLYEHAAKYPPLYDMIETLLDKMTKRDLSDFLINADFIHIVSIIGANKRYYLQLLKFLASCPNPSNNTVFFRYLTGISISDFKESFKTDSFKNLAGISVDDFEEIFKSAISNLNPLNVTNDLAQDVLKVLKHKAKQLSLDLQTETLFWLLEGLNKESGAANVCLEELFKIIGNDSRLVKKAIPIISKFVRCDNEYTKSMAFMGAIRILQKSSHDALLCRKLLNVIMTKTAFENLCDIQVKVVLHTLWLLQKTNHEKLQKEAVHHMHFFLKNYNFYKTPLAPIDWAVEKESDDLWNNIVKMISLQRYSRQAEIVAELLQLKDYLAENPKVQERLYLFLKNYLETTITLGYNDYMEVRTLLKRKNLLSKIKPRMNQQGKEKQKILLKLIF